MGLFQGYNFVYVEVYVVYDSPLPLPRHPYTMEIMPHVQIRHNLSMTMKTIIFKLFFQVYRMKSPEFKMKYERKSLLINKLLDTTEDCKKLAEIELELEHIKWDVGGVR